MNCDDIHFGVCQRCGQDGRDQTSGLSDADTPATATEGNGIELIRYSDGRYLCDVCVKVLDDEKIDLRSAELHEDEKDFRSRAGFTDEV